MGAVTRAGGAVSALLLWFSHDKLTGVQVVWCWGLLLLMAGWYALSCWWFPFGNCWCCKGRGRHSRKDGRVHRDCKWVCKGTGRRRRWGRTLFETARKVKKNTV